MRTLQAAAIWLAIGGTVLAASAEQPSGPASLRRLAQRIRTDFEIGSFADGLNSPDREPLAAFFRENFSIVTVGVYMMSTQRQPGPVVFSRTDPVVEFARSNHLKVYLHPLIGGAQYCPKWINEGTHTPDELRAIMRERITDIFTHYRGAIAYADVVNEALTGGGRDEQGRFLWLTKAKEGEHVWMKKLGMYRGRQHEFPQYLVDAFRFARETGGPDVKLVLNEYDNGTTKSRRGLAFLALCEALRAEGIPLDGAGLQLHCAIKGGKLVEWGNTPFDFDAFAAMLQRYAEAGIEVHITEFDIHLPPQPTPEDFELQGRCYAEILKHALAAPAVKTFKTWGFTDKYSWKANGIDGHPLMLDEAFRPKPAYRRMVEMLTAMGSATR